MELEIALSDGIVIDCSGVTPYTPLPKSFTLLKTIQLPAEPICLCHYKGIVYVALDNGTVAQIDSDFQVYESFITSCYYVVSILAHNDALYVLSHGGNGVFRVTVFDMSGKQIVRWNHSCDWDPSDVLTIVSDQVVMADPFEGRITIYSLTGQMIRQIPCNTISGCSVSVCDADDSSIVVSIVNSSKVFRLDLNTGNIMWTSTDIFEPFAVQRYGKRHVFAANNVHDRELNILDIKTGELLINYLYNYCS